MTLLSIDFETYFDTKLSLNKMTTMEYVRHPDFKVWGVGVRYVGEDTATWYGEDEVEDYIHSIPWGSVSMIAHNAMFDAYILTQYYGVTPAYYYDTAAMARGLWPGQSARLADVAERVFPTTLTCVKAMNLSTPKASTCHKHRRTDRRLLHTGCGPNPHHLRRTMAGLSQQELELINLTAKMFVEPKLMVDKTTTKYRDREITNAEQLIEASGIDKKVLSSNQQFTEYLENEHNIIAPTKKSPTTGEQIPALGKNDAGYKQLCNKHPELQHIWDARIVVKSRIAETRAQRFLDACNRAERSACRFDMQHTLVALAAQKKSTCKTYLEAARYVSRSPRKAG